MCKDKRLIEISKMISQQNKKNEEIFFLSLAVRLKMNYNTTVFQIKDIHKNIATGKKSFEDYSPDLRKLYEYYLNYLDIIV